MPARTYNPQFDQRVFEKTQGLGDYARIHSERDLLPRIAERVKQTLNVAPEFYRFYQRASTGRRCSCWEGVESTPSSQCLVCFGTGNTAGYQLYGHQTEVFDITAEWASVNVVIDYDDVTRPLHFRLAHRARSGYVDFLYTPRGGIGVCSLANLHASAPRGTQVSALVKLFSEATWVPFSRDNIAARLKDALKFGGMQLRVVLNRDAVGVKSPRLSHVRVRTQTLPDDKVPVDINRSTEVNRSSEFGWFDEYSSSSVFLGNTLRAITTEDFFVSVRNGFRWKIVQVNPNVPAGVLTSWDCETRLIQSSERLAYVP